jgi:hypothetical protein
MAFPSIRCRSVESVRAGLRANDDSSGSIRFAHEMHPHRPIGGIESADVVESAQLGLRLYRLRASRLGFRT